MSGLYGFPKNGCLGPNDDVKFMQKANNIEFPCENSPHQVNIWVEKGTKAKEVTPQRVSVTNTVCHGEQVLIQIKQSDQLQFGATSFKVRNVCYVQL